MADVHHVHHEETADRGENTAMLLVVLLLAILAIAAFAFFAFNGTAFRGTNDTGTDIDVNMPADTNNLTPTTPTAPGATTTP
jgi:hypothetical protein